MRTKIATLVACTAWFQGLGLANQIQLAITPNSQTVFVGSTVQIGVGISLLNIGEPPSLGAYDMNMLFDPSLFSFSSVIFGDPVLGNQLDLFGRGSLQFVTPGTGSVNFFELSFDSAADLDTFQAGDFTLFTVTLLSLAPGTSTLSLGVNSLADAVGGPITFLTEDGSATAISATSEIPEPSSGIMLLLGLSLLVVRRFHFFR